MSEDARDLSGQWYSLYRYPSSGRGTDLWSRHVLEATQEGNRLHLESDTSTTSRVVMDLTVDFETETAAGEWREETNPEGYYEGRVYTGTIELRLTDGSERLDGVWHGESRDGTMNSDVWEIARKPFEASNHTDTLE